MSSHQRASPATTLQIGSAVSTIAETATAAQTAAHQALQALEGTPPHVAFVFFSPHHSPRVEEIVAPVLSQVSPARLLGCSAEAVIAQGQEIEAGPAVAVWAAHLPGAELHPFTLAIEETPDGSALVGFPLLDEELRAVLLLADPFTFPITSFLDDMNSNHPEAAVIGGMASGDTQPGGNLLVFDDSVRNFGAAGVAIGGSVSIRSVVSQGCRPIGDPYTITGCEVNVITELGGEPPLNRLRQVVSDLPPADQALVQGGLLVGVVIDEQKSDPAAGDFLIRSFRMHPETGAMALGEEVQVGQTVQFQLRDAAAAHEELQGLLQKARSPQATGALMFTCNGRGTRMFEAPHHDAQTLETILGRIPAAGMFCQGELGPVGGRNFLHGFTSSIALFSENPQP